MDHYGFQAKHFQPDECVIKVDCPKGEKLDFAPCGNHSQADRNYMLRSRHSMLKLTPGPRRHLGQLGSMPEVPGQFICLSVERGVGRLVDPLSFEDEPRMAAVMDDLLRRFAAQPIKAFGVRGLRPIPERTEKLDGIGAATWLLHMRRAVAERSRWDEEEQRTVSWRYARVIQAGKHDLLECPEDQVEKHVPAWRLARVQTRTGGRSNVPVTQADFEIFRRGVIEWETFLQDRFRAERDKVAP